MKKSELPLSVREAIKFNVTLYYGGGLGDLAHRMYDSYYLCRLRSIREYFPNIKIILQINTTRSLSSAKSLFELNPYINQLLVYPEWCMNRDIYVFATNLIGKYKDEFGLFQADVANELVFHRVVNKIHELLSFPHIQAINMNELFSLFNLDIMEFEADAPAIYLNADEEKFGKELKAKMCPAGEKLIGLHLFSNDEIRMPDPTFTKDMISLLLKQGYKLAILGTAEEADPLKIENVKIRDMAYALQTFMSDPNVSYHCDNLSIRHKTAIIKNCDYMIANDSGLMHIAWLNKIKTISLLREEVVCEEWRFKRVTGYWWALAAKMPFASLILFNQECKFNLELINRRITELGG